jgi:acyl dehydratase
VNDSGVRRVGAVMTLTKQVSEADVALFALVMGETQITAEEPPIPPRQTHQIVPMALVSALLATAAARLSDRPGGAQLSTGTIRYLEAAYTDDTLTATAEISGYDAAARALHILARCETADGRRLADGEYVLSDL